jgi:hypothetical protein
MCIDDWDWMDWIIVIMLPVDVVLVLFAIYAVIAYQKEDLYCNKKRAELYKWLGKKNK